MDFSQFDKDRKIWEDGARLIRRDCQPFLSQVSIRHAFSLYRGMRMGGREEKFIKKQVRLDDRRPTEMGGDFHKVLNDYFTERYGAPFRNAIFATGDEDSSGYFGINYSIFPTGSFEFLWSPQIDDLNFHMHDLLDDVFNNRDSPVPPTKAQQAEGLLKRMRKIEYRTDDLTAAINSGNEIMIRSKEYYALPIDMIDKTGMLNPLMDILEQDP